MIRRLGIGLGSGLCGLGLALFAYCALPMWSHNDMFSSTAWAQGIKEPDLVPMGPLCYVAMWAVACFTAGSVALGLALPHRHRGDA